MKELSIEEKAKHYDEVFERAKIEKEKSRNLGMLEFIDENFPELAESEDERIKKALISFLKSPFVNENITDEKVAPWIAWLKKQGEQKPYGLREECKDCQFNYAGECKGFCQIKKVEQKPVEPTDIRTWKYIADAVLTEWNGIGQYLDNPRTETIAKKLQERFDNIEQKPVEWSEEDEKLFQSALWHIKNSCGNQGKTSGEFDVYNFVKSLKDRVQPQPKPEWSDEDEKMLKRLISVLNICYNKETEEQYNGNRDAQPSYYTELIDWLKSLRPQNTWKPSEEQMDALESAIVDSISSIQKHSLESLYNELKKL